MDGRVEVLEGESEHCQREVENAAAKVSELKQIVRALGGPPPPPAGGGGREGGREGGIDGGRGGAARSRDKAQTAFRESSSGGSGGVDKQRGENSRSESCSTGVSTAHQPQRQNVSVNVDFETALDQMFNTLEDLPVPVAASLYSLPHTPAAGGPGTGTAPAGLQSPVGGRPVTLTSLRGVDHRLEELKQEKLRLRQLLLDRVDS